MELKVIEPSELADVVGGRVNPVQQMPKDAAAALSILRRHNRRAEVIGRVIADQSKGVFLPRERLAGHGKQFRAL